MSERQCFYIHHDTRQFVDILRDDEAGELFKALFAYSIDGTTRTFDDRAVTMAFLALRKVIDDGRARYESKCAKNRENAMKRYVVDGGKDSPGTPGTGTPTDGAFIEPTPAQVDDYISELARQGKRGYDFTGTEFVDHYQANGWKVGKNTMKDWKAACRSWAAKRASGDSKNPHTGMILNDSVDKFKNEKSW